MGTSGISDYEHRVRDIARRQLQNVDVKKPPSISSTRFRGIMTASTGYFFTGLVKMLTS
jgi:hypothetical protein